MKFVVLTTTPNEYSPQRIKKEFEAAGHEVVTVNPDDCYIHIGPDPYISHEGKKLTEADVCIPRFNDENAEYKLAIINHFENMGVFVVNPANSVRLANNKLDSQIFLFKNGFKTPRSVMLTNENQLEFAVKSLDTEYPVIVKTLFGRGGVGVMKIDSYASLKSVVQLLLERGVKFVIQEFMENKGAYRIMTIGGKFVAGMFRAVDTDKDFRTNSDQGSKEEAYKPKEREIAVAEQISKLSGINFCAIDYMLDEEGEPVIFEFNSSPGFETISKANPDIEIIKDLLEYCVQEVETLKNKVGQSEAPVADETLAHDAQDVSVTDHTEAEHKEHEASETADQEAAEHAEVEQVDLTGEVNAEEQPNTVHSDDGIIGVETEVVVKRFNDEKPILARVDTGATLSSIHGTDIKVGEDGNSISFNFNGMRYKCWIKREAHIRTADGGRNDRHVVELDIVIDGEEFKNIEFSISDREEMKYDMLIGRNALAQANLVVDPREDSAPPNP